jgi:hypothetical protein
MVARMVDLCLSTGKGTEAVCMLLKRGAVSLASHTNLRAEALLKRGDLVRKTKTRKKKSQTPFPPFPWVLICLSFFFFFLSFFFFF